MINFRNIPHLPRFNKNRGRKIRTIPGKAISLLTAHKFLALILISLILLGGAGIGVRSYLISKIKISPNESNSFLSHSPTPSTLSLASKSTSDNSVLGTSTESTSNRSAGSKDTSTPFPSLLPDPTFAPTPAPTSTPVVTVTSSSSSSSTTSTSSGSSYACGSVGVPPAGEPTEYNSEASPAQSVSDTATIKIQLLDCNNHYAPVSDTLDITQSSGPATTVNGGTPPMSIETTNGQASFTVRSQTSGTVVYVVTDARRHFTVTAPGYKNPQVTFNFSAPAPTAAPTPAPVPTSSPTPTPTPSDSPTPSPSPTDTSSPVPSPSPT